MKNLRSGFTLLEIMLSLAIFALLLGGIYTALYGTFQTVEGLYGEQDRQMSDAALAELLRKNFASLPESAVVTLSVRRLRDGALSDLVVENAPGVFVLGNGAWHYGRTVFASEAGSDGSIRVGIVQVPEQRGATPRSLWLAEGFREFRWEFYSVREQRWVGEWTSGGEHPALARVLYRRKDDTISTEVTFAFPWSAPRPIVVTNQNG